MFLDSSGREDGGARSSDSWFGDGPGTLLGILP